jgi:hypothetical protein
LAPQGTERVWYLAKLLVERRLPVNFVVNLYRRMALMAARITPTVLAAAALLLPIVALADVPVVPGHDLTSEEAVAKLLLDGVMNGQWGLVVSLSLMALVYFGRKYTPPSSKLGIWLRTKLGGVVSTLLIALTGGFVTQFLAGAALSVSMVLKAVSLALGANGLWSVVKNIGEAVGESKASDAGKATEATPPPDTLNQ